MTKFQSERERMAAVVQRWKEPTVGPNAPRGTPFEYLLTNEDYMQLLMRTPCHFCGDEVAGNYIEPIDSDLPVHTSNSIAVCVPCKRLKGDLSRAEYLKACQDGSKP